MAQIAINKYKDSQTMPQRIVEQVQALTDSIRQRAYGLFQGRNGGSSDVDDWLRAEREMTGWPESELIENNKEFRARIALPGFDAKEIEVSALPDALVVQAESTHHHDDKGGEVHFCEFSGKKLYRRFNLPGPVDVDKVTASVDKGILQVTAPKAISKRAAAA